MSEPLAEGPRAIDPRFQVPERRVIALALFLVAIFWFARPVILPFVVGALIAYAFSPYIDAAQARTGRSRLLIVVAGYGTALLIVGLVVLAFSAPLSREIALLIDSGPNALTTALRQLLGSDSITIGDLTFTVEEIAARVQAAVSSFLQTPEGALRAAEGLLRGALDVVLTIIVAFYLLLDGDRLGNTALRFVEPGDRAQMRAVASRVHVVVGQWLRGQLLLVALVAVVVSLVLGPILNLPYPVALGVMVGLLDVITLIGPLVAGTIVAIVALSTGGPTLAIVAVAFLFVLRQLENVVLMPIVLGRAVHLHPLVALFAVVVGSTAFGVVGTFLALPVAAAINVALHEFFPAELGPITTEAEAHEATRSAAAAVPPPVTRSAEPVEPSSSPGRS
ncbi:MAG: AI-2E family transporter [Chloroflexota bacterium]